ncbi:MAG: hypothetical protein HGA45_22185 [Chloroflexales bacterium]|nr:hypothetical protein [Chloroflexales bacterium]
MGCLFALFAGCFPRLATMFIWLARPSLFEAAFGGSWFWPLLGIIFLPFSTLMYVLLWSPVGLVGWDWFWLILAVVLDITHYAGSLYGGRERIPGYSTRATV